MSVVRGVVRFWRWFGVCGLVVGLVAGLLATAPSAFGVAGYGDVDADRYFTEAVQWAVDAGVAGIDGACFSPDEPVTRGEAAVFIWRMQGRPSGSAHSFVDVVADWQQAPVSWMSEVGITTGTSPTTFSPDVQLTRAHIAGFLYRLAGEPSASAHSFVDVVADWQQAPVSWMSEVGITTGMSPTTFHLIRC